jgi:hypothetical protein
MKRLSIQSGAWLKTRIANILSQSFILLILHKEKKVEKKVDKKIWVGEGF